MTARQVIPAAAYSVPCESALPPNQGMQPATTGVLDIPLVLDHRDSKPSHVPGGYGYGHSTGKAGSYAHAPEVHHRRHIL